MKTSSGRDTSSVSGDILSNPVLFGSNPDPGLVAVEPVQEEGKPDSMLLFVRAGNDTLQVREPFKPFIVADVRALSARGADLEKCPVPFQGIDLAGNGQLKTLLSFSTWADCVAAKSWLAGVAGVNPSAPDAPLLFINDPVRQHLTSTGRTMFKGMDFVNLKRMQVDIECIVSDGFEFCNADREGDRIIVIALADQSGWSEAIGGPGMDEKQMLERFVAVLRERDPDVIEGHNVFNFDLPYIRARAKRHKVKLKIGRDGSEPRRRASRIAMGDRQIAYERFEVFGRHVVDTLFLVQAYDLSERSLDGYGLKEVAVHFGIAAENRVYIDGSDITRMWKDDPGRVLAYAKDDVEETRSVSDMLSRSSFVQTRMLPYSYQNACVRGNATRIDSLMVREYLRQGHALPLPALPRQFEGGHTDIFFTGVARNVHHCDVRSLYPSLMLARSIGPVRDNLGVFLAMLKTLRECRLDAKERAKKSPDAVDRSMYEALQGAFKILINSFYGYLGASQSQFSDFDAAERVTADGRELLKKMIDDLKNAGARPIEIDTDGIYFVPPDFKTSAEAGRFREDFQKKLPAGIEVEFDGEYEAMFSYKMKNYALLRSDGEMTIKGAALKSRGLERFQRSFLKRLLRLKLEGREQDIPGLKEEYEKAITGHALDIRELAKTVTLQDSPSTYAAKIGQKSRNRDAAYELALKSEREYRAGDQLSFYITGTKKSVSAYENAKLASQWNPEHRDENAAYYLAKLDALYRKFYDGMMLPGFESGNADEPEN